LSGNTGCPTYLVILQGEDESLIQELVLLLLVGDFEVHAIEEVLCKIIARPEHRVLELWPKIIVRFFPENSLAAIS
jgi:hypothetical protein